MTDTIRLNGVTLNAPDAISRSPQAGDREPGDVIGEPVQVRAGGADSGPAGLFVGVQTVWVAQQHAGDVPCSQRSRWRGGRRWLAGPPRPDMILHGGVAAAVAHGAELAEQDGGVGDSVGPAPP